MDNIHYWSQKIFELVAVKEIAIEIVRFDMQQMDNPEISGVEYQRGELFGYEVREYLLEKWQRQCAYCGATGVPLQVEHIFPRSRGGSDRVSNLTIACRKCNAEKSNQAIEEFLAHDPTRLEKILSQAKTPLKDAAAVNMTRYAIAERLQTLPVPVGLYSGGQTKYNRFKQGYDKEHWIDAACVGPTGREIIIPSALVPLSIQASGRGTRQVCRVNKYGFPRTTAKRTKRVKGFQTGDMVRAVVSKGKKMGTYLGRVAIRKSGNFNITISTGVVQGISHRYCRLLQHVNGYGYC